MNHAFDIVVAGGGVAGIAAALAASRMGMKTCLVEKEYALGGLATLGLIVIYLPLCDGRGQLMSTGLAEELLKLSVKDGPGEIPAAWKTDAGTQQRAQQRYRVQYNAATFMINAEKALVDAGVTILYDGRLSGVQSEGGAVKSIRIESKRGPVTLQAGAFIDATGDADLCFFAGENTVDDSTNRRTGWYFGSDGKEITLHQLSDPIYDQIPETSRLYSGTDIFQISQHMIDMRSWIVGHAKQRGDGYHPLLIPAFHGFRMTRRLKGSFEFSEDAHENIWFQDAIGMIGNWKKAGPRYSLPLRAIEGIKNKNLYAAGRCVSAEKSGWDLTRVIPSCAVTGQAAGVAAALHAKHGKRAEYKDIARELIAQGVVLDDGLFEQVQDIC